MREGVADSWVEYRENYHQFLHRLYELNPQNIILADRGFTDCVYNSDEQMREEFRRLAACYGDAKILYFYPGELRWSNESLEDTDAPGRHDRLTHQSGGRDVLYGRGSRDMPKLTRILREYETLLQMFSYEYVNTAALEVDEATEQAEQIVLDWHQSGEHSPDV